MERRSSQPEITKVITTIKAYFDPFIETDISRWMALEKFISLETVMNKTVIKAAGEKEDKLRFILKGGGVKLLQKADKEICFDICFENEFFSDFESLNSEEPTNIRLLNFEPLELAVINSNILKALYEESYSHAQIGRILAEQQGLRMQRQQLYTIGTIDEKYERLMKDKREVIQRTPLYYIASFLRTSPQSLSRIRKGS